MAANYRITAHARQAKNEGYLPVYSLDDPSLDSINQEWNELLENPAIVFHDYLKGGDGFLELIELRKAPNGYNVHTILKLERFDFSLEKVS